jgi:hypothetical protein
MATVLELADELLDVLFDASPVGATVLGIRGRDDRLTDYSETRRRRPAHPCPGHRGARRGGAARRDSARSRGWGLDALFRRRVWLEVLRSR